MFTGPSGWHSMRYFLITSCPFFTNASFGSLIVPPVRLIRESRGIFISDMPSSLLRFCNGWEDLTIADGLEPQQASPNHVQYLTILGVQTERDEASG